MDYSTFMGMELEGEIWKDVPISGFEDQYQVSNFGRMKSLARTWYPNPGSERYHPDMIMQQAHDKKGHARIALSGSGRRRNFAIARLVASAFLPNKHPYHDDSVVIIHKNGNHSDNRVDNLEYYDKHLFYIYENGRKKLTKEQVVMIRNLASGEVRPMGFWKDLSKLLGISVTHLYNVINNVSFDDITTYDPHTMKLERTHKKITYHSIENKKARRSLRAAQDWRSGLLKEKVRERCAKITVPCEYCGKIISPRSAKQLYNLKHKGYIYCSPECVRLSRSKGPVD